MNNAVDAQFNAYGFEAATHPSNGTNGAGVANNLYPQNGPRYGLAAPGRTPSGGDAKHNGLHGVKHKRGEVDRECMFFFSLKEPRFDTMFFSQPVCWHSSGRPPR